jgi:hypothetical protein
MVGEGWRARGTHSRHAKLVRTCCTCVGERGRAVRNQFQQEFVGELAGHCKSYCQTVSNVLSKEHEQVIDL